MPAPDAVLYIRTALLAFVLTSLMVVYAPSLAAVAIAFPGALLLVWIGRARRLVLVAVAAATAAAVLAWYHAHQWLDGRLPEACTREPVRIEGHIASLPRASRTAAGQRQRFEFAVASMQPVACAGPRRVLLSYYGEATLAPGQGWALAARLRPPRGLVNPGSADFSAWYAETGIHAVGSVGASIQRRPQWDRPLRYLHHRLRAQISTAVTEAGLGTGPAAVLRAITVADKSGIDHPLWTRLQLLGGNHLLVISGLHVGMVAAIGLLVGTLLGRLPGRPCGSLAPLLGPLLGLAVATLYTALAGFTVATSRALLMLGVAVLARLLLRRAASWSVWLLALVVVVLVNPLSLLGSGLALSFAAVAALLWFAQWRTPQRRFRAAVGVHIYMSAVMLPLGALWFGGASVVAAPANLVLVPLFTVVLVPLALAGAVLALSGASELAHGAWRLAGRLLQWVLDAASAVPEAGFVALLPSGVAAVLGLLAVAVWCLPVSRWRKLSAGLLMLPLFHAPVPVAVPTLTVLDVGQGTAVLFTAADRALLYDTGGGNPAGANLAQSVVLPYLHQRGIAALDVLVVSHGDNDHAAGEAAVTAAMAPGLSWRGGSGGRTGRQRRCQAGQTWEWPGGATFRMLSPGVDDEGSSNNLSCVLMIELEGSRILLAGDISAARERELIRYWGVALAADVLLVGHHGSGSSTSQSWLNHVHPALALLSHGWGNRFGHPHPQVLARLRGQGVRVLSTAHAGALELQLGPGGEWRIAAARKMRKNWRL